MSVSESSDKELLITQPYKDNMMFELNETAITESKTLRSSLTQYVDILDKIKTIAALPDDLYVTTEIVANYYEVGVEAVKSIVKDHREELAGNGYQVLKGKELAAFKTEVPEGPLSYKGVRALAVFNRHTVLNIGMLLVESPVAKSVREYLLKAEASLTVDKRLDIIEIPKEELLTLQRDANRYMVLKAGNLALPFDKVCATLSADPKIDIGRTTLLKAMRSKGILTGDNTPMRKYYDYFTVGQEIHNGRAYVVSKVKPDGVLWLRQLILNEKLPGKLK